MKGMMIIPFDPCGPFVAGAVAMVPAELVAECRLLHIGGQALAGRSSARQSAAILGWR
jgi:hypothetical protein